MARNRKRETINRKTMLIRAPKALWEDLRRTFPGVCDQDIIRLTVNTSLVKFEKDLNKIDFKDNLGRFLYGKDWWDNKFGKKTNKKQER